MLTIMDLLPGGAIVPFALTTAPSGAFLRYAALCLRQCRAHWLASLPQSSNSHSRIAGLWLAR
jgi:hypothetical protein